MLDRLAGGPPAAPAGGAWVAQRSPSAPERGGSPSSEPPAEGLPDPRPRVLVADDDAVTVRVLRHRFERDGLAVDTVADGIDALDALRAVPPAVALVNVALAGVDGFEVLRRVRAGDVGAPGLPLALMGWAGNDALIVRGFALDADDFIVRPFSLAEVSARIRRLARRTPHAR